MVDCNVCCNEVLLTKDGKCPNCKMTPVRFGFACNQCRRVLGASQSYCPGCSNPIITGWPGIVHDPLAFLLSAIISPVPFGAVLVALLIFLTEKPYDLGRLVQYLGVGLLVGIGLFSAVGKKYRLSTKRLARVKLFLMGKLPQDATDPIEQSRCFDFDVRPDRWKEIRRIHHLDIFDVTLGMRKSEELVFYQWLAEQSVVDGTTALIRRVQIDPEAAKEGIKALSQVSEDRERAVVFLLERIVGLESLTGGREVLVQAATEAIQSLLDDNTRLILRSYLGHKSQAVGQCAKKLLGE